MNYRLAINLAAITVMIATLAALASGSDPFKVFAFEKLINYNYIYYVKYFYIAYVYVRPT